MLPVLQLWPLSFECLSAFYGEFSSFYFLCSFFFHFMECLNDGEYERQLQSVLEVSDPVVRLAMDFATPRVVVLAKAPVFQFPVVYRYCTKEVSSNVKNHTILLPLVTLLTKPCLLKFPVKLRICIRFYD